MIREYALRQDLTELGKAVDLAAASRPTIETVSEEFENAGLTEVDVDVQLIAVSFANGREFLDDPIAKLMVFPEVRSLLPMDHGGRRSVHAVRARRHRQVLVGGRLRAHRQRRLRLGSSPVKTLVCRCEDVTLHELDDAMARGYRDIESVKRYTGFGTGWCQGKWCLALCARLVAERGGEVDEADHPAPAVPPRLARGPRRPRRRRAARSREALTPRRPPRAR